MFKLSAAFAAVLIPLAPLFADGGAARPDLKTDPEALADFSARRLGFMIHWGPCTTIPTEIGWGIGGNRRRYEATYAPFDPKKLDLNQWADVAARMGAKYSMLVAKHHDGFCLWDTKTTPVNVMNSKLHRDVLKEYFEAFRKKPGMLPGAYLSIIDVSKQNDTRVYAARTQPPAKLPPGGIPEMVKFTGDQVDELMNNYGATLLWFDGHWLSGWDEKAGAEIYERIHKNNPKAIAPKRLGGDVGDYTSMEARLGEYRPDPWETVTSVAYPNYSWNPKLRYKTPAECVQSLVRVAVGNGNLLLNFVPDPDGEISAEQVAIADAMGAWLKKNGESIYGTRGGPWYPAPWGGSTYRGDHVFIHALPESPAKLRLAPTKDKIVAAKTLSGKAIRWNVSTDGEVTLQLPPEVRDPVDTVVELTLEKPVSGMVASKESPSIFRDPAYGKLISADATLTVGNASPQDKPADHASLFSGKDAASGHAFVTADDAAPSVTVDLGKRKTLTGVAIRNGKSGANAAAGLTLEVSVDGKSWKQVWKAANVRPLWEIPLTDFSDHTTDVQGEPARYLRLTAHPKKPGPLHLAKVEVYGVE